MMNVLAHTDSYSGCSTAAAIIWPTLNMAKAQLQAKEHSNCDLSSPCHMAPQLALRTAAPTKLLHPAGPDTAKPLRLPHRLTCISHKLSLRLGLLLLGSAWGFGVSPAAQHPSVKPAAAAAAWHQQHCGALGVALCVACWDCCLLCCCCCRDLLRVAEHLQGEVDAKTDGSKNRWQTFQGHSSLNSNKCTHVMTRK